MNPRRRSLLALFALAPLPALAQQAPAAGVNYTELRPPQPVPAGKIDVIEFFCYCNATGYAHMHTLYK